MKTCAQCGQSFSRPSSVGFAAWSTRRFCGKACEGLGRRSAAHGCEAVGCENQARGAGPLCNAHRQHLQRFGTLEPMRRPAWERFVDRVLVQADDCWRWMGSATTVGYGQMWVDRGRTTLAHRYSYETMVGPVPDGLHLDHLCMNKLCVNPAHLEPVTPRENTLRYLAAVRGV